jgi:hypothetical protein
VEQQRRVVLPLHLRAERLHDVDRNRHVADLRHVMEDDLLIGEQARDDLFGRRVLGTARLDAPSKRGATFDSIG